MAKRQWYKGDTHLHTNNSDGLLTKGQLVEQCKKLGLDFAIITDHNYNTVEKDYYDGELLVIQGQELTAEPGHINVWGKKIKAQPPYILDSEQDYKEIIDECKKSGAVISVNHPFCSQCGFHMDLESFDFDCVEVWNTIQHSDNIKNMDWWAGQLLKGKHIAAVGGSDFHRDYTAALKLLANPTTIVHATGNTPEEILCAIKEGRSVVTNKPDTSMIYLTCGEYSVGDTLKLTPDTKILLRITKLKKDHIVKVFNNDKVIYEMKSNSNTELFETEIEVKETGFVRAQIDYTFKPAMNSLYKFVENKFLHTSVSSLPPFFWAFTNPIWFE